MKRILVFVILTVLSLALCAFASCERGGASHRSDPEQSAVSGDSSSDAVSEYSLPTKIVNYNSDGSSFVNQILYDGDSFTIVFGSGFSLPVQRAVREFDADGKLLSTRTYDNDGGLFVRWEYTYDADGRETQCVGGYTDRPDEYTEVSYDGDGNRAKVIQHYEDGRVIRVTEYDPDGRRTWTTHYNEDGSVSSYAEKLFDERGNMVKWSSCDPDEVVYWLWEHTYEYDGDGKLLKERQHGRTADGNESIEYTYEYDENGQPTKRLSADGDAPLRGSETLEYGTVSLTEAQYLRYCELIRTLFFLPVS